MAGPNRHYVCLALAVALLAMAAPAMAGPAAPPRNYTAVIQEISTFLRVTQSSPNSTRNITNFWAPRMLRLGWHASGTWSPNPPPERRNKGGSNGATMRFFPESNYTSNKGLDVTRNQLETIKQKFPWITYGDLWTLAACVAVKNMGGPRILWRPGRTDARNNSTCAPDGRLPNESRGAAHVRAIFRRMNLTDAETVALIGAHSVGGAHVEVSQHKGRWSLTPQKFDNAFFVNLRDLTWAPKTTDGVENKPWRGPFQWESPEVGKFGNLPLHLMMLPTDMALRDDAAFFRWVNAYADNQALFFNTFASAFKKVLEFGVTFPAGTQTIRV